MLCFEFCFYSLICFVSSPDTTLDMQKQVGSRLAGFVRLRKKMLNESNTPAFLNSVVTLWDVFVMFSKSNFWGENCLSCSPAVCPLAGLPSCCYVWMSSPYLLSELLGLHCSQLRVRRSILTMALAPKLWFIERPNGAEIPWKCLLSFLIHLTWWSGCHVRCWGCARIEFVSVLLPCRTGTSCGELITRSALTLNASAKFP